MQGEKAQLKTQLQAAHKELEPFTSSVNEAKSAVDIVQQELDLLTSNARNIAGQLKDAESNLDKATSMVCFRELWIGLAHACHGYPALAAIADALAAVSCAMADAGVTRTPLPVSFLRDCRITRAHPKSEKWKLAERSHRRNSRSARRGLRR